MSLAYLLVFYFGGIMGSFLNVVALRLPQEKSLSGRSHCGACGHILSWLDLFPLFSYLWLRGRCRYCKKTISSRYFLSELLTGFLFVFAYWQISPRDLLGYLLLLKTWVAISALFVVFVVDLEHFLIFDSVLVSAGLPVVILNLVLDFMNGRRVLAPDLASLTLGGLFAGSLFAGVFYALWYFSRGRWIGFGDVKLMFFLGLVLGWPNTAAAWLLAYFLGTIYALPLLITKKKQLTSRLPFGCFLSPAALFAMFYGPNLVNWYLRMIGM